MLFVQHTKKAFCSGVSSHLSFPSALSESRGRRCLICHHSLVSWPSALSCKHLSCFSAHPSAAGVIVFIDTLCLWHIGVMREKNRRILIAFLWSHHCLGGLKASYCGSSLLKWLRLSIEETTASRQGGWLQFLPVRYNNDNNNGFSVFFIFYKCLPSDSHQFHTHWHPQSKLYWSSLRLIALLKGTLTVGGQHYSFHTLFFPNT